MTMHGRFRSAFNGSVDRLDVERARFERIACELERIAAWLRNRNANSEQANRLFEQARKIRQDNYLPAA